MAPGQSIVRSPVLPRRLARWILRVRPRSNTSWRPRSCRYLRRWRSESRHGRAGRSSTWCRMSGGGVVARRPRSAESASLRAPRSRARQSAICTCDHRSPADRRLSRPQGVLRSLCQTVDTIGGPVGSLSVQARSGSQIGSHRQRHPTKTLECGGLTENFWRSTDLRLPSSRASSPTACVSLLNAC